ncbi:MAG: hypothetical protein M3011_11180 [Actinomycetota bacterium]|nr:hypothetical protein [Actinomycetota bacterium]
MTAMLAMGALAYRAETVGTTALKGGASYAPAFRGEVAGPGAMLNAHDGQAFGSLALDPLLRRPTDWTGGRPEMAYRAARPFLGWLVMVTSFGSTTAAAWSLLVWTAIGIGVMAAGALVLASHWGRGGDWVPLLLLLPGVAGQLLFGGLSDGLATGFALLGLAWWLERHDRWAIMALCVAVLCRETTLLVPVALLLSADRDRRLRLLTPFCAYAGWVGVVWLRLHVLPATGHPGLLGVPPLNFFTTVPSWSWIEVLGAASIVALLVVAWVRAPGTEIRWLVALSALFGLTLGPFVLRSWDFTRPLLPVTVIGACLLARKVAEPGPKAADPALAVSDGGSDLLLRRP